MPIFSISAEVLERVIIGMHFGGFDSVEMAHDISHKYLDLKAMQPDDISALFEHQKRIRSLAWTQCTQENTGQSPTVRRVLMDITGLPNNIKRKMGRHVDNNNSNSNAGGATKPRTVDPDFRNYTREERERGFRPDHKKGRAANGDRRGNAHPKPEIKITDLEMHW